MIGGMLAETLIGRLFVPAIFYVAEKFSGAEKRKALPLAPAEAPRYEEPSILRNSSCGRSGSRLHDGPEVQTACRMLLKNTVRRNRDKPPKLRRLATSNGASFIRPSGVAGSSNDET